MKFLRRMTSQAIAAAVAICLAAPSQVSGQDTAAAPGLGDQPPMMTVYGRNSKTLEGDHDFRQVIFFSVPASHTERLYLRVFDPDAGGTLDTVFGSSWPIEGDTKTRFAVFGGDGAFVANVSVTGSPLATELSAGTILVEETFDLDETADGQWRTIALLDPAMGDLVDGARVFRLLVEGIAGNDGNLFSVAMSSEVGRNQTIEGTRIFSFLPTVRVPNENDVIELSFPIPAGAKILRVNNFDASFGRAVFTSRFRSVELATSGQNEWNASEFALRVDEQGTVAALVFSGGREMPNDLTFHVSTSAGALLPVNLPPKLLKPNKRPTLSHRVTPLSCTGFAFDATGSSDPDGQELSYLWHFGDGTSISGLQVDHDYPAPGKYAARLEVTDASGHIGNGTAQDFNVTVKQKPVAIPRARAVVARDVPVLFDGTASTSGGWPIARYVWTFEDGTTRVGAKVQHRFATSGPQTVKLRIIDISDHPCDTAEAAIALHVNARPVAEAGNGGRAAIAQVVTFDAGQSADTDGTLAAYRWQLGDGTVKQGRKIEHAYARPGTYKVTLTVTDDAGVENSAGTDSTDIFVNAPPVPVAGEDAVLTIGQTVVFDSRASADTDGHIISRHWDMGDGTRLSGLSVEHAYAKPGTYAVTLTVTDDAGVSNSTTRDSLQVVVNAPPVAEAGDERRVAVGETVRLSAASSDDSDGEVSSYRWNMGDGTVLEGRDIEHRYSQLGDHAVVLEVIDSAGIANSVDLDHVRVLVNAPPNADAGADVASAIGEVVQFDATSSADPDGNIVSYEWDFGDGGKTTGPKPRHAYHALGEYRVTLTIRDDSRTSTDTAMASMVVRVTDAPNTSPVAEAGTDVKVIVGQKVHFDGTVSHDPDGSVIAHEWDFGDGFTSSGPVPVYAYREAGTYTVTLLVRDNSGLGNDTHTDTMTVYVDEPPNTAPTPAAGKDQSAAIGEPVIFDASASKDPDGNILSYKWDFADGQTAEGVSTVHAFDKSGTYEVVLTLQDDARANTGISRDSLLVRVNEPPVADAGPDQLVTASLVEFDGTGSTDSDGKVATYVWDFGDGGRGTGPKPTHVYREPGTYEISLTVGDDSGTIRNTAGDKMQVVVNAAPIADAGPDLIGEPGEKLVFQGDRSVDPDGSIVTWVWNFKDGATATGSIVEHAFEKPGTYYVGLRVQDDTGHGNAIDYAETIVAINAAPTADAGPDLRAAPGDDVTLNAANSFDPDGELIDYRWDFSDTQEPLAGRSVTRKFDKPGVYKAQLTVVDDSDVNNGIAEDEVTIAINHAPVAAAGRSVVTSELRVVFDASESADADGDGLIYSWSFGDGQTATGARVAHTYTGGGVYSVVLTVDDGTDLNNATDQDSMTVKINRPPVALAGESKRVCTNDVVVFDGSKSTDPEKGVLRYAWDFGDGSVSDIVNPTKTFDKPGTYPVTLRVEDESGLQNSTHLDRIMIKVDQAPAASAGPDVLACVNTEVKFDGSKSIDVDGVVNRFTWDFGDGASGGGDRPSHIYRLPGKYRVLLNIEGDRGNQCDNTSSDEAWVRVIEAPVAKIAAARATPVNFATKFDGAGSTFTGGKISRWEWDFGDGETAHGPVVEHTFATPGTYRVALTIHSDAEISDCRSITAYQVVEVNQAPVAMPGPDLEVSVNQDALFDGSASADPDGGIVAYAWDFGDGSNGTGMQVHHQYQKAGR